MRISLAIVIASLIAIATSGTSQAQSRQTTRYVTGVPVPGIGKKIDYLGDDFEDPAWKFIYNHPKSSSELNERTYSPMAYSVNRRWAEGPMRGQPDVVKVIPTPPGGLEGSEHALQISTLRSGIPGVNTNDVQQDDLIMNVAARLGSPVRVEDVPSCTVRVYLPEASLWENRSGPHFGIRVGVRTTIRKPREGLFAVGSAMTNEPYWPGIWIHFRSETSRGVEADSAYLKIRGNGRGGDFSAKEIPIDQFGWWTFGMSVSADGRIHYFGKPGTDDLTIEDHLSSQYPYGYQAERFNSFFFNICNHNNGRTWSTPFVIDDPAFFVVRSSRVDQIVTRKVEYAKRRAQAAAARSKKMTKKRR